MYQNDVYEAQAKFTLHAREERITRVLHPPHSRFSLPSLRMSSWDKEAQSLESFAICLRGELSQRIPAIFLFSLFFHR